MVAKVEHEAERERARTAEKRARADGISTDLAQVRADGAEQIAGVERHVAELRQVVEAMRAPAAEARAREAALEAKIKAVRVEAAALGAMPWWRRLVG